MSERLKVGVVFGGRSGEHEVSLVSAASIIHALDKKKYDVIQIGVTKNGQWFSGDDILEIMRANKKAGAEKEVSLLPDPTKRGLFEIKSGKFLPLDVVFPVIHGTYGEDGTIQGLLELAGIPYVGAGVLGSSVGMDKIVQKDIARQVGITVAPSLWFLSAEFKNNRKAVIKRVEETLSYPIFVKPANSGSSVGIHKAHNSTELEEYINDAARYDRRVVVEKGIEDAREIEVSVLGNDNPVASCPGEVISSNEFYDYDAKYVDGKSKTIAPADIPTDVAERIKTIAVKAFKALDLCGMARMDFLVTRDKIYFNEANTIPGFTSISMYPKLFAAGGMSYPRLLDELISLAIERFEEKSRFLTSYRPKEEWYKS